MRTAMLPMLQRAERQRGVLDAEGGMSRVLEDGAALADGALNSSDPSATNRAADVFHDYVDTLRAVGWVGDAKAADIKRNWATGIAERVLLQASPEDRVAAIAAAKVESKSESEPAAATGAEVPASAAIPSIDTAQPQASSDLTQLVRMLPAEVRERIDLESQAEIGRTQATRVWEKAGQYEDAMEKASRGEPQPAPWRAAIEADPDLDDRTRARLLQKHDAMQQKLDRFWSIKAEYDKRNGRKFDGNDDNDRTFVEQMYTRLGADMPALHAVANRAGIMPEAALDDFKGRLRSQDPDKVSQALSDLQGLARRFESLSTLGGKETADLQNDLSEFVFYRRAGRLKDQAVQEFIKARSPEAEAQRQAKLKGVDIHAVVMQVTPPALFDRVFGGNPAVTSSVVTTYRGLLRERYIATADIDLARAQTNAQMKPLLDAQADEAARRDAAGRPSWTERAWLNGLDAFVNNTVAGSAWFKYLKNLADEVEATRPEALQALLYKKFPGLKKVGWTERQQYELQWLKSAPERFRKIQADLDRYKEMKLSGSASEFSAAVTGQVVGSMLSPESYIGWQVKGATWLVRGLKAALQQAGIAGVADLATQANLIQAGVQDKIDGWRTGGAMVGGAVVGGLTPSNGGANSGHVGVTPEGLPKPHASPPEMTADGSLPVAPRSDAPDLVTPEALGSPLLKDKDAVPGLPTSSETQAVVPQETLTPSSISGERAPGPTLAEAQSPKAEAQGVAAQEMPGSPVSKSDELASSASTSEARTLVPQETLAPSSVSGEKDPAQVSVQSQAPKPTRWEQIDLDKHESADGKYHTIKKHVGKGFEYLQDRLNRETLIPRASTYLDKKQADYAVNMVIENRADDIAKWLADPKSGLRKDFKYSIPVDNPGYMPTGFVLGRKDKHIVSGKGALVFIEKDVGMPNGFRIVTSYPIP